MFNTMDEHANKALSGPEAHCTFRVIAFLVMICYRVAVLAMVPVVGLVSAWFVSMAIVCYSSLQVAGACAWLIQKVVGPPQAKCTECAAASSDDGANSVAASAAFEPARQAQHEELGGSTVKKEASEVFPDTNWEEQQQVEDSAIQALAAAPTTGLLPTFTSSAKSTAASSDDWTMMAETTAAFDLARKEQKDVLAWDCEADYEEEQEDAIAWDCEEGQEEDAVSWDCEVDGEEEQAEVAGDVNWAQQQQDHAGQSADDAADLSFDEQWANLPADYLAMVQDICSRKICSSSEVLESEARTDEDTGTWGLGYAPDGLELQPQEVQAPDEAEGLMLMVEDEI